MTNLKTRLEGRQEGFTLIELLIVVLIIGILAAIAIPVFNGQRNKAKDSKAKSGVRNAYSAAKSHFTENESFVGLYSAGPPVVDNIKVNEASLTGVGTETATTGPSTIFVNVTDADTVRLCSKSETGTFFCIVDDANAVTRPSGAAVTATTGGW